MRPSATPSLPQARIMVQFGHGQWIETSSQAVFGYVDSGGNGTMNQKKEPNALVEVRDWKRRVAKETKELRGSSLFAYYNRFVKSSKQKKAA